MTYRTTRKIDPPAFAICAALLGALGACSADDEPVGSSTPGAAASRVSESIALAAEPSVGVPPPAADAPVQEPNSSAPLPNPVATPVAKADVQPTAGNEAHGTVEFFLAQPSIVINVELAGLKPGNHGLHVHENGDCGGANASAAGGHLNPNGAPHGDPQAADQSHHAGDLGNVRAEQDGTVNQRLRTEDLHLQGAAGIVGKAIVVHTGNDDMKSQPSGESGVPIACGVIKAIAW